MSDEIKTKKTPNARWWRIIIPCILIYIVAYMDRTNIAFAIAGGMNEEMGISASLAGLAAGIFFIGYMILPVPGGHIAEKGKTTNFVAWSIAAWGVLSVATGFVQNATQLLVLRFLLGVAEGGTWPAIMVLITNWFPKKEMGRANALFVSNLAFATIITGPLSGWIISVWDWRYVFIIEGLITIPLIAIWLAMISERPEDAKWISKEEKEFLVTTLKAEKEELLKTMINAPVNYKQMCTDVNVWKLVVIYFCYQTGNYGYTIWLPSIIKELTKTGIGIVGLLSTLPWIATLVGLYVIGYFSDRSQNRRLTVVFTMISFAVCFFVATEFKSIMWLSFLLLVMSGFFIKPTTGIFWTMPPLLFPTGVAGGVRGVIVAFGNLGGFVGPFIVGWITTRYHNSDYGIMALVCFLLVGALVTMTMPKITAGPLKK
jgi:MFS family permease